MPDKRVEEHILVMCQRRVPGFPTGRVVPRESPDFHVITSSQTVGVELQEFVQGAAASGSGGREGESLRGRVMQEAQRLFEATHPGVYLYVYSHWNRWNDLRMPDVRGIASMIAACVDELLRSQPTQSARLVAFDAAADALESAGLGDRLVSLHVMRYAPATYGLWASPESGFATSDLGEVQVQVSAKDGKVAQYRASCDLLWLVLYSMASPSGAFDMEALAGATVTTSFDHVVLIDAVSEHWLLLA